MRHLLTGVVVASAIVAGSLMLSLQESTSAAPPEPRMPFASAVDQRIEMIDQLRQIRVLLQEQNALLRQQNSLLESGKLRVVISKSAE